MSRLATILGAAALFGAAASGAQAALPIGTLSFVQPDATAGPTDAIDVVLRFTLSPDSDPFAVDADGFLTAGAPSEQELLDRGFAVDTPYATAISYSGLCTGSFFQNGCSDPYVFDFAYGFTGISLQPGESVDFRFGRFTPAGGTAAPGTYNFYSARLQVVAYRAPANGPYEEARFTIGDTCTDGDFDCDFTRTVVGGGSGGVPEPATWALMILGFGAAGSALRRSRRAAAVA